MTDADTPRVPDLWWSATKGLLTRSEVKQFVRGILPDDELPADAVKLGDGEGLRTEISWLTQKDQESMREFIQLRREFNALRADIRAALEPCCPPGDPYAQIAAARTILGRESGREEPTATPPDRSGRWVDGQLQPFGPHDLDGWQPTHPEAVAGD